MPRTTEQWEALLDGITPGPWEAREDHGGMNLFAGSERVFGSDSCGDVSGEEEDVRIAAAAPEAVAEVVRLRRVLEERIRIWQKVAEKMDSNGDTDVGDVMRYMIRNLTRILEGDTDE